jgi:HlyD family secretion protein
MLTGILTHISADASEAATIQDPSSEVAPSTSYKARVKLDQQNLIDPHGNHLTLTPGMQVVVEIHQGKRTVMEYLLSPVKKAVQEAGRER